MQSDGNREVSPQQQQVWLRYELCQHCGIVSTPRVRSVSRSNAPASVPARVSTSSSPGSDCITVLVCRDCSGIRAVLAG